MIGLMGGIGSGKSVAARLLGQLGCAVIDADELARDVLQSPEVQQELVRWWGPRVLDSQGRVDRQAVGRIVFADPEQLARLEGLIHPRVAQLRHEQRQGYQRDPAVRAIVEDCPLLLEKGLDAECDVTIFIDAPLHQRLERVRQSRGWDEQELHRREKNQLPLDRKADRADYVLENSSGENRLFSDLRRVLSQILQNASLIRGDSGV